MNANFAYFSWLELGCPDVGAQLPAAYSSSVRLTEGVRERAEMLLQDALAFARTPGALSGPPGGGRARVTAE